MLYIWPMVLPHCIILTAQSCVSVLVEWVLHQYSLLQAGRKAHSDSVDISGANRKACAVSLVSVQTFIQAGAGKLCAEQWSGRGGEGEGREGCNKAAESGDGQGMGGLSSGRERDWPHCCVPYSIPLSSQIGINWTGSSDLAGAGLSRPFATAVDFPEQGECYLISRRLAGWKIPLQGIVQSAEVSLHQCEGISIGCFQEVPFPLPVSFWFRKGCLFCDAICMSSRSNRA